jgi:hypothetical protein
VTNIRTTMTVHPGDRGIDVAVRPNPKAIVANGFTFVVRYITNRDNSWKVITSAEAQALHDVGLGILLVYEVNETRANGGAPIGAIDGQLARSAAIRAGYPLGLPVLFAVDTDTWSANIAAHEAYLRAAFAAVQPYGGGVYGDTDIIARVGRDSALNWLANATGWRGTRDQSLVDVIQHRTDLVNGWDPNTVVNEFQCWGFDGMPVPPHQPEVVPLPTPSLEDDMTTVHITVANQERFAEFWTVASLNPAGEPHCLFVTWSGPGGTEQQAFADDHGSDSKVVHVSYSLETFRRDLILLGDPTQIEDMRAPGGRWSASDFYAVR